MTHKDKDTKTNTNKHMRQLPFKAGPVLGGLCPVVHLARLILPAGHLDDIGFLQGRRDMHVGDSVKCGEGSW